MGIVETSTYSKETIEEEEVKRMEPAQPSKRDESSESDKRDLTKPSTSKTDIDKNISEPFEVAGYNPDQFLNLFKQKKFLASEPWDNRIFLQGQIVSVEKDYVDCDCLMNKKHLLFERRRFPRFLFEHITILEKEQYIYIKIYSKPGSSRIDVFEGEKLVNKEFFTTKSTIEKIEGLDFNDKPEDGPTKV